VTGVLGAQERAILRQLIEQQGRVVSRQELARRCGLSDLHERRCDSLLVRVRQVVGADALVTVRRRGWMLRPEFADAASAYLAELDDQPAAGA
jgi:DNA-binding response OmpR family regulator